MVKDSSSLLLSLAGKTSMTIPQPILFSAQPMSEPQEATTSCNLLSKPLVMSSARSNLPKEYCRHLMDTAQVGRASESEFGRRGIFADGRSTRQRPSRPNGTVFTEHQRAASHGERFSSRPCRSTEAGSGGGSCNFCRSSGRRWASCPVRHVGSLQCR